MKEQFATYEVSKQLKELGFDEPCLAWYEKDGNLLPKSGCTLEYGITNKNLHKINVLAPLYQQVKNWLWERHEIIPFYDRGEINEWKWYCWLSNTTDSDNGGCVRSEADFDSPMGAEIEGIKKAVEYLYNKKI